MSDVTENVRINMEAGYAGFVGENALVRDLDRIKHHFSEMWNAGAGGKIKLGTDVGMGIGAAALGIGVVAAKEAVQVQDAANRVQATYSVSKQNMAGFSSFVQENSAKLLQSQTALWQGIGQAVSQGFGPQMTQNVVTGASKIATVFQTTLTEAIKPAAIAIKDFNLQAAQVPGAYDLMAKAASKVQGGWAALFSGPVSRVFSTAGADGLSMEQTLSAAVTIAQRTGGGRAMQALNSLLMAINKDPGGQASLQGNGLVGTVQGILAKYGGNQKDLTKMLGGSANIQLAQILAGSNGDMLAGSSGYLNTSFGKISKDLPEQWKALQLQFEDMAVTVGRSLIPVLHQLMDTIVPIVHATSAWMQQHPQLAAGIIKVGIAIGAMSVATRVAMAGMVALRVAMIAVWVATNPVTLGLAATGVALYLLYTRSKQFHDAVNNIGTSIELAFLHPAQAAANVLHWFEANWPKLFLIAINPFVAFNTFVLRMFAPQLYANLTSALGQIGGFFTGIWNSTINSGILKPFKDALSWVAGFGQRFVQMMIDGLKAGYGMLPGPVRGLAEKITGPIGALASWAYNSGKTIAGNLAAGISAGSSAVQSAVKGAVAFTTGAAGPPGSAVGGDPGTNFYIPGTSYGNFTANPTYGPYVSGDEASEFTTVGARPKGAITDVDYGSGGQSQPISLPAGFHGKLIGRYTITGLGGVLIFQVPGGYVGINHVMPNAAFNSLSFGNYGGGPLPGVMSGWPTDPKYGNGVAGPANAHLCIFYDAGGRAYVASLTPQQQTQLGATPIDGSGATSVPTSVPIPSLPPTGTGYTDHTGQPGWYMDANGTWKHVSPPHASNYTWDASTNKWIPTAAFQGIQSAQGGLAHEAALLHGLTWAWNGVNPANIPMTGNHGINQQAWLKAQYKINELKREEYDQTAKIAYLRGQITLAELKQIQTLDNLSKNTANQQAYARIHPGSVGAANHAVPVHMVGHCEAEARKEKAVSQLVDTAGQAKDHNKRTEAHTAGLRTDVQRLTVVMMHLVNLVARGTGHPGDILDPLSGVHAVPTH